MTKQEQQDQLKHEAAKYVEETKQKIIQDDIMKECEWNKIAEDWIRNDRVKEIDRKCCEQKLNTICDTCILRMSCNLI